jgi:hypothetical protein
MTTDQIQSLQRRIGTTPDGIWGPKSTRAAQHHLLSMMPDPNPWPSPDRRSVEKFFGDPGNNLTRIDVSGYGVIFQGKPVDSIRCNVMVAESLYDIIRRLYAAGFDTLLANYAGVYNNRSIRGGTRPSLHAYGAAIDLHPAGNGNHTHWPTGAVMPIEAMEIFAREGWTAAGAFWSRDAMHFQATKP